MLVRRGHIREPALAIVYLLGVCAMTLSEEFARYLSGLTPLFILLILTPALGAVRTLTRGRGMLLLGIAALLVAGQLLVLGHIYVTDFRPANHWTREGRDVQYQLFSYGPTFEDFDRAVSWVGAHADAEAVIASSQPLWVFLRTGRRSVMPPFERDRVRHQSLLPSVPVDYLIVDSSGFSATREYSLPAIQASPLWEGVYQADTAAVSGASAGDDAVVPIGGLAACRKSNG